jgi:hypothetical protein
MILFILWRFSYLNIDEIEKRDENSNIEFK